ncbi:MAG: monovalent cation/H+ antiporter subunit D family protein [Planctomycetes bacterium]|nr:monovalent cation/H+ antiporter subunit D family protein [Planctomycetota bacterium]
MSEHFPVLVVVVPMLSAPLCFLSRNGRAARGISFFALLSCLLMVIHLLGRVLDEGVVSYRLGGWPPPLGIEYRYDQINAFVALIVAFVATVVVPFGQNKKAFRVPAGRTNVIYAVYLLCTSGLLGMCVTGDLFNVYVFLEISSLSAYTLVAIGAERRAMMSAFSYLTMGTIGGLFFLIGIGMLYQMTGTLNIVDLSMRLYDVSSVRTLSVAFATLFVGVSIKLAVFPLHQWLPNAYTYAPPKVSAFLAATATKVAFYVMLRIIFTIFGRERSFEQMNLDRILLPLSIAAMFMGSIAAIYQTNIKRLLAFSSIAQIGYMTLGISLDSLTGLVGGIVHLFNHALMKGGLFLAVACILFRLGSVKIDDMRGIGRRMPWTMGAVVVLGLGLVGVPGTVGFVSKWYLVLGALERELYVVAFLTLVSSLLAVVYVWRLVEVAWFSDPKPGIRMAEVREAPLTMVVPVWALAAATIYFGIFTEHSAGVARLAAAQLFGGTP